MLLISASHFSTVMCPMLYIYKENLSFNETIRHSENTICKLFEKYIVEELDTVHRHFV